MVFSFSRAASSLKPSAMLGGASDAPPPRAESPFMLAIDSDASVLALETEAAAIARRQ